MGLSTSQLRAHWAPHCEGPWARVDLHGEGRVTVRASIVDAVKALDRVLEQHRYRTRRADTGAYNCRRITGGVGYSLHAYGIAIDINWQSNPYGPRLVTDMSPAMVADIKALRTVSGHQVWRWGGDYRGNKDAMHFEVVASPAQIATGIAGTATRPTPIPTTSEEDDMPLLLVTKEGDNTIWLTDLVTKSKIVNTVHLEQVQFLLKALGRSTEVRTVTALVLDNIPRNIPDADWLAFASGIATSAAAAVARQTGTTVDVDGIADSVVDELRRRLAS